MITGPMLIFSIFKINLDDRKIIKMINDMKIIKISFAIILILIVASSGVIAQTTATQTATAKTEQVKLYDPALDGMKQIKEAIAVADKAGKHVLIQYGGNWCGWCIKFDAFCKADTSISKIINAGYIPVKLNYSPENKNDAANQFMGNPTRFGFPVFVIIDGKGKVLHIQDSGLLEEGAGYNKQKVMGFFRNWTTSAIIPVVPKKTPAK
jgi:thioredoxin-related protein